MMKANILILGVAPVLAAFSLGATARAEDWGASTSSTLPSKIERDINQAAGSVDKPSTDIDKQVQDLEATRAAVDEQKKPAISLSVSGWVSQQVQYNVK